MNACWLILMATCQADGPLGLEDLPAYRAALGSVADPESIAFRQVWDDPESLRGRPVRVGVRVARVFRQAAIGSFPALVEVWGWDEGKNPFVLVYPAEAGVPPREGARVAFVGTFLKMITYQATDAERAAPLIVGPGAPQAEAAGLEGSQVERWDLLGWAIAGLLGIAVVMALIRQRPRGPSSRTATDPAPEFIDGPPGSSS